MVWAGEQTAGRGRMRRRWHSPAHSGLWFSVVLRPEAPAAEVMALPLAVGVAVGSALDALAPGQVRLKWPNDVLLGSRKVAGILVDAEVTEGTMTHAVVGVGVNLARPSNGFDAEIGLSAAAMADVLSGPPAPGRTLAAILAALEAGYDELLAHGPGEARRRWLELADTIGREVVAQSGGETIQGTAIDLDAQGNLVVMEAGRRRIVAYGEVDHLR
jgi:BirA family biotin operon repressor/biotin-[acetyl-CoA-carboxylase] ligase